MRLSYTSPGSDTLKDMDRTFFILGAVLAGLSVGIGAFGAHGLRDRVDAALLANFETGARYHMYHALALFAVAWAVQRWPTSPLPPIAGWLMVARGVADGRRDRVVRRLAVCDGADRSALARRGDAVRWRGLPHCLGLVGIHRLARRLTSLSAVGPVCARCRVAGAWLTAVCPVKDHSCRPNLFTPSTKPLKR